MNQGLWEQEQKRLREEQLRQQQLRIDAANNTISKEQEKREALLNCWRNEITYISPEAYQQAARPRLFRNDRPAPTAPRWDKEEKSLASAIRREHLAEQPVPWIFRVCSVVATMLLCFLAYLVVGGVSGVIVGVLLAAAVGTGSWVGVTWWWCQEFESRVSKGTEQRWPSKKAELEARHNEELRQYAVQVTEDRAAWDSYELDRTKYCRMLVAGDVDALDQAISDSLSDLNFPFDAACASSVIRPDLAVVNLDLPEIEDVIGETKLGMSAGGHLKETKRRQSDRYADYSQLVAGLVLWIATTALSAAPSVQTVKIAAYTQRKTRGELRDEYVVIADVSRSLMQSVDDIRTCDALASLTKLHAIYEQNAHGKLKTIKAPTWEEVA